MNKNEFDLRFATQSYLFALILMFSIGCNRETSAPDSAQAKPPFTQAKVNLIPITNMVPIKAGSFNRQSYTVTISRDFWIGKYEVTQAEYGALMGKNPSHFQNRPTAPVEKVTYFDAMSYCTALTQGERQAGRISPEFEYRLPSEAQWEYACRAGTTNLYSFGDEQKEAAQYSWTWENSEETTHPVGLKLPNPWGLYDMHGNVWEWCLDWFGEYPASDTTDPKGDTKGKFKVFRGGGWNNEAQFARSANRFMMAPASGIHFVGFRVVLDRVYDR